MKKLFMLFCLLPTLLIAWTGSNAAVRLIYPKSYYYEPKMEGELLATPVTWQRYIVPRGIYGIVVNEGQGIDKYQLILHNLTTVEAWLIHDEQDWNSTDYTLLSKNELIKKSLFNRQNSYMLELIAWDLNGDTQSDTAVFDPFSNTGIYTRGRGNIPQSSNGIFNRRGSISKRVNGAC